jgi:hypothetical protein
MCHILLERIKDELENILSKEQSGFRKKRSCTDNISLRNITKQGLEWISPLYINYIDFEKAFDSIHRVTLWNILEVYGVTRKIIGTIKDMCDGFRCTVRHERSTAHWFTITSGVRQGCIISSFLFPQCIDWMMERVTEEPRGIHWTFTSCLEEIDFVDNISLLSHTKHHTQENTAKMKDKNGKIGLKINQRKSKVMRISIEIPTNSVWVGKIFGR